MSHIYTGTVGLRIRVHVGIDISGAGAVRIRVTKPNTDVVNWTAQIESAEMGIIYYDTQLNDLDIAGVWYINGVWDPDGDNIYYGNTACLDVHDPGVHC